jgi:RHS repeat-associated protein
MARHVAGIQAESELIDVAMKVLFAGLVVDAMKSALQNRPNTLNAISARHSLDVFVRGMVDALMSVEQASQIVISRVLIGIKRRSDFDVRVNGVLNFVLCRAEKWESLRLSTALPHSENGNFADCPPSEPLLISFVLVRFESADECLVNFYLAAQFVHVFPNGFAQAVEHEPCGFLCDSNLFGNTIQYVYDALNRLTQKTYPDSTTAEYTYDLVGKILQANDPTGTYAFAYDNMGRLVGTTTTYSFLSNNNFTNSYSYDADSNRTGYTAPDSSTNTYSYDTLNRLATLANSWAGSFGFSYDALSRRTQMTRPNGIATNYSYDKLSHLLSVLHQVGSSTIDGEAYTLDPAGNRTAKQDYLAGVTSNYTYDKIYELTQVTQGTNTTESYSYDPVGSRLSSLGVSSYTNNTSNELTSTSNASYAYDNNGNTTSETNSTGTTSYSWDYENRLTSVTLPNSGGTVTFKYDPFGRRIEKISPTATSIFVYDGDNLVETVNGSGGEVASYAQAPGIDQPLAMQRGTTTSFYEQDGLGSVTSLSNSSGALVQSYTYDSFGNQTASSGSLTNFFRYTGREFDTETNLYFYRARYYDSSSGRFISEDPLQFEADVNFYAYVDNSPLIYFDPFGLKCTCTYSQSSGSFSCTNDGTGQPVLSSTGYSGIGPGLNNPGMQGVPYVGPIPVGTYTIGPPQTNSPGGHKTGPLTFPLTPDPGTNTFNRPGLLIHGDNNAQNHTASNGCIVLDNPTRKKLAGCRGGKLLVGP